ncbi:MAG: hypothetical protein Q9165_007045 [Trypethelium subeluteriae]
MCYVLTLDTWEQKYFRLPSSRVEAITTRNRMVAALISGEKPLVVCYNSTDSRTWSFTLQDLPPLHVAAALLLQPERCSMVVFSASTRDPRRAELLDVQYSFGSTRYSYSGSKLSTNVLDREADLVTNSSIHHFEAEIDTRPGGIHPIDYSGNFHIWPNPFQTDARDPPLNNTACAFLSVIYSEEKNRLFAIDQHRHSNYDHKEPVFSFSRWKDMEYYVGGDTTQDCIIVSRSAGTDPFDAKRCFRTSLLCDEPIDAQEDKVCSHISVNERYLVIWRKKSLHVWCFDGGTPLPMGPDELLATPRQVVRNLKAFSYALSFNAPADHIITA